MNAEEIILTIYDKCKEAYEEKKEFGQYLGYKDIATEKAISVWLALDELYTEITGKEIDY